jgi:hypothetical protein
MRVPSAAELLDLWEWGLTQTEAHRALALLSAVYPESDPDQLARLPLGSRDTRLANLRRHLFGSDMPLVMPCPACGAQLESSLRVEDIWSDEGDTVADRQECVIEGYEITFRLPASYDLVALPAQPDVTSPYRSLLARCLVSVRNPHGHQITPDELPEGIASLTAARMSSADPRADVQLQLACPSCMHRWQAVFDIASFLWKEIHAWAQHTLRDVHTLARAYGWREIDVLALSPTRRQIYLELARR